MVRWENFGGHTPKTTRTTDPRANRRNWTDRGGCFHVSGCVCARECVFCIKYILTLNRSVSDVLFNLLLAIILLITSGWGERVRVSLGWRFFKFEITFLHNLGLPQFVASWELLTSQFLWKIPEKSRCLMKEKWKKSHSGCTELSQVEGQRTLSHTQTKAGLITEGPSIRRGNATTVHTCCWRFTRCRQAGWFVG